MNTDPIAESSDHRIELQRAQRRLPRGYLFKSWERVNQACVRIPRTCAVIVDVGCDNGNGTFVFRSAFPAARIVGVECVPERLEMARCFLDEGHEGFFQDAPIAPGSVDVVYSGEVIEHVTYAEAETFVAKAATILRTGGQLILTTPNPNYIRLWLTGRKITDEPSHLSQWSLTALKRLVQRHGFAVDHAEGTGRMTRRVGTILPITPCYGSYMLFAHKTGQVS